jgi:rod shape-determining protein MreD
MSARMREPRGAVLLTGLIALVLQVLPLPGVVASGRPPFLVLVVLYWSIVAPRAGGLTLGFVAGLTLDAFQGSVLGQHALAVALVTYLAIRFHLQLRTKPVFQQALFALGALFLYEAVLWSIDGWSGHPLSTPWRWLQPLTGAVIWPLVVALLERTHARR